MTLQEFITTLNTWGQQKIPFLFWIDFELEKPVAFKISEIDHRKILYNISGVSNGKPSPVISSKTNLRKSPVSFTDYENKFSKVAYHLNYGDSFLTNLTIKTEIEIDRSLSDLFYVSKAKYKLFVRDQFLVFSPEIFVKIEHNRIVSYPMKGTIDASIHGAAEAILKDTKEMAEHVTIVDLIRNDLSMVAHNVQVSRFRYLEVIKTNHKNLLQVSSEITGDLPVNWQSRLGDIIVTLLPAGSICGAPKKRTVEIIAQAEQEKRGYYTGVVGYFDGEELDSGVMIRFIEQAGKKFYYRSGGGITTQSIPEIEYSEMMDKIYVPVD